MRHLICISFLVQIFRQFIRAISWNYILNCWNAEQWIFAPVKASCMQLFDAKEQVKPVIIRGLNQLLIGSLKQATGSLILVGIP